MEIDRDKGFDTQKHFYKIGNMYKKKKVAVAKSRIDMFWGSFNRVALELADAWRPNWKSHEFKHFVKFNKNINKFENDFTRTFIMPGVIYLPDKESAEKLADWANENMAYANKFFTA